MRSFLVKQQDRRRKRRGEEELKSIAQQRAVGLALELERRLLEETAPGVNRTLEHELIISLTSFQQRLDNVHLTIESLMRQTVKASRIILNIAANDFSPQTIPDSLKLQQKRGLEIAFIEEDLGPYTKYFYTLKNHPESLILTVDDDIMYPIDLVAKLYAAYRHEPDVIHCLRAHRILRNDQGQLLPYKQWNFNTSHCTAGFDIFPTGVGGVLYFPGCFAEEIFNKELFLELAPGADDVWLKAMSLKKGVRCKKLADVRSWTLRFPLIPDSQVVSLKRKNKQKQGGNNEKIARVFDHFNLRDKIFD